jgi:hypothetical protein
VVCAAVGAGVGVGVAGGASWNGGISLRALASAAGAAGASRSFILMYMTVPTRQTNVPETSNPTCVSRVIFASSIRSAYWIPP